MGESLPLYYCVLRWGNFPTTKIQWSVLLVIACDTDCLGKTRQTCLQTTCPYVNQNSAGPPWTSLISIHVWLHLESSFPKNLHMKFYPSLARFTLWRNNCLSPANFVFFPLLQDFSQQSGSLLVITGHHWHLSHGDYKVSV